MFASATRTDMKGIDLKAAKAAALDKIEYCNYYDCPGDCGQPHNAEEFRSYSRHVLIAFDSLDSDDRRSIKNAAADVRRKARGLI